MKKIKNKINKSKDDKYSREEQSKRNWTLLIENNGGNRRRRNNEEEKTPDKNILGGNVFGKIFVEYSEWKNTVGEEVNLKGVIAMKNYWRKVKAINPRKININQPIGNETIQRIAVDFEENTRHENTQKEGIRKMG